MRIRDLPCIWISGTEPNPVAAQRLATHFPDSRNVAVSTREQIRSAIEGVEGDWLLVLPSDCLVYSTLAIMETEPAIIASGVPCSFLSRNTVTNEIVTGYGPALWPRPGLIEALEKDEPNLSPAPYLPSIQAHWFANPDPETTLRNGYENTRRLIPSETPEVVARSASLGSDVRFGAFWQIGCCHALLGTASVADALDDVADLLDDERAASRAAAALSCSVRLSGAWEVQNLPDAASRLMKGLRSESVPANYYEGFAEFCEALGEDFSSRAQQYREAAYWLGRDGHTPQ